MIMQIGIAILLYGIIFLSFIGGDYLIDSVSRECQKETYKSGIKFCSLIIILGLVILVVGLVGEKIANVQLWTRSCSQP